MKNELSKEVVVELDNPVNDRIGLGVAIGVLLSLAMWGILILAGLSLTGCTASVHVELGGWSSGYDDEGLEQMLEEDDVNWNNEEEEK